MCDVVIKLTEEISDSTSTSLGLEQYAPSEVGWEASIVFSASPPTGFFFILASVKLLVTVPVNASKM